MVIQISPRVEVAFAQSKVALYRVKLTFGVAIPGFLGLRLVFVSNEICVLGLILTSL